VESRANTATATGQIGLRTAAGGSGATAAYEMFLTSGSVSVGMRAEATSGGGRIVFTAGQFLLSDPAYGQAPVFVWNSATGRFAFNVPLLINGNVAINGDATINGDAVVNGTLTGAKIVDTSVPGEKLNNNAVSNTMSAVATTSGNPLLDQVSVAVPLRAGARAVVIGTAVPIGVTSYGGGGTALVGTMAIRVNGSDLTNIPVFQSVLSAPSNGEFGSSPGEAAITATADQALYTAPSAGTYTFTLFHSQSSFPKRLTITVTELFK